MASKKNRQIAYIIGTAAVLLLFYKKKPMPTLLPDPVIIPEPSTPVRVIPATPVRVNPIPKTSTPIVVARPLPKVIFNEISPYTGVVPPLKTPTPIVVARPLPKVISNSQKPADAMFVPPPSRFSMPNNFQAPNIFGL
jgi:hypothetical protein